MAGKEKIKIYEYNKKGKFIQEFESISDFRATHYPRIPTKALFLKKFNNIRYQLTPSDTLAFEERPGRDLVILLHKITKSKYCNLYESHIDGQPVQVLNLKGEILAEFKSIRIASLLVPQVSKNTIDGQIKRSKNYTKHFGTRELLFRYKPKLLC